GPGIEPRKQSSVATATATSGCRRREGRRKARPVAPLPRGAIGTSRGPRPRARTETSRTGTGRSLGCLWSVYRRPHREVERRTPMMDGRGKSDKPIVPAKPSNKALERAAETVEERGVAKGNAPERNALRTQSREGAPSALERVRQIARRDRKQRFTALLHHVYDIDRLRRAYYGLRPDAAAGVDGETWRAYGDNLDTNLQALAV